LNLRALLRTTLPAALLASASACAALTVSACGDDSVRTRSTGEPPDASLFDPGKGPAPAGGYYGPDTEPVCPEDLRRCLVTFTFPFGGETSVELRGDYRGDESWSQGDAMTLSGTRWSVSVPVPPGKPVQYKFCIDGCKTSDKWALDPDPTVQKVTDPQSNTNSVRQPTTCDSTWVCDEPPLPPPGVFDWRDAVLYFVFVDRFNDGNTQNDTQVPGVSGPPGQYQGGDYAGVTQKIQSGYFDELGVNVLWLTVPLDNADVAGKGAGGDDKTYSAYHGYWPKEFDPKTPESHFGTGADLKALVAAAHAKNIRVLFDYAMVHVHATSSVYAAHPEWFYPGGGSCVCGVTCDWNADAKRCWFTDYLPHWNYNVQAARDFSVSNAIDWAKEYGIDGFRLDAIKHVEDSWLADLRRRLTAEVVPLQSPPQRFYLVGETFSYNPSEIKYYVDPAAKLDGQFDFPLRLQIVKSVLMRSSGMDSLASFMRDNDNAYGSRAVMSPFVGNHDLGRVIHMAEDTPAWDEYSNGDKALGWSPTEPAQPSGVNPYERLANAFGVLFTMKGAPLIYYGDEIGLAGAGDPGNRKMMPWTGWNAHQTWLRTRIAKLTSIRAQHASLRRGLRQTLTATANLWVFSMTTTGDKVFVAINRGDGPETASAIPTDTYEELVEGGAPASPPFTIPARQTRIFVKK
jgi:glycosidase